MSKRRRPKPTLWWILRPRSLLLTCALSTMVKVLMTAWSWLGSSIQTLMCPRSPWMTQCQQPLQMVTLSVRRPITLLSQSGIQKIMVWSLLNPLLKDLLLPWSHLLITLLQKLLRTLPPRTPRTLQYSFNFLTFLYPILFSNNLKCPFSWTDEEGQSRRCGGF